MRQFPFSTQPKEALQTRAWNKSPVLGRKPGADPVMSPPIAVPSRFGHDFTGLGLRPADAERPGCSLFPQRCPFGGACHLCPPRMQAKLKIGMPGDPLEKEADRVAARVADSGVAHFADEAPATLQRATGAAPPIRTDPAEVYRPLAESGQPMADEVREPMEQGFGQDFKTVRIHANATATCAARAVNALAFTVGRHVVFQCSYYKPQSATGRRLLAHELTHVVQQTGGASMAVARQGAGCSTCNRGEQDGVIQRQALREDEEVDISRAGGVPADILQRAGDPAQIPPGLPCLTDLTLGRPAGTDVQFATGRSAITPAHTAMLTVFRDVWVNSGGTDDILVHGYASEPGDQGSNWTLSCNRALSVRGELVRLGIPAVRIDVVAHGESTDFGAGSTPNEHAVVSSSPGGMLPIAFGLLTPRDNFASRSLVRFGVGEIVDLSFFSLPLRPAADFGGLEWHLASGAGALSAVTNTGTATYTAPAAAGAARLELRMATGATAGRAISAHDITIVEPSGVHMTVVPGTAPDFAGGILAGTWGAGFMANVFVDPRDVSFQGVVFGEGTVAGVVTGTFLSSRTGKVHPANTFGPAHGGNATTGTPVSPPVDNIASFGGVTPANLLGVDICGVSSFLWAIPWEFSVAGGPRTRISGGFTANHFIVSDSPCRASISKGGAGPFCRRLNGTAC